MEILLPTAVFLIVIAIFAGSYLLFNKEEGRSIHSAAERYSPVLQDENKISLLQDRKLSNIPILHRFLASLPLLGKLNTLMQQAKVNLLVGEFLLIDAICAMGTLWLCSLRNMSYAFVFLFALIAVSIPFLILLSRRKKERIRF